VGVVGDELGGVEETIGDGGNAGEERGIEGDDNGDVGTGIGRDGVGEVVEVMDTEEGGLEGIVGGDVGGMGGGQLSSKQKISTIFEY
jgi:hypothetical protein